MVHSRSDPCTNAAVARRTRVRVGRIVIASVITASALVLSSSSHAQDSNDPYPPATRYSAELWAKDHPLWPLARAAEVERSLGAALLSGAQRTLRRVLEMQRRATSARGSVAESSGRPLALAELRSAWQKVSEESLIDPNIANDYELRVDADGAEGARTSRSEFGLRAWSATVWPSHDGVDLPFAMHVEEDGRVYVAWDVPYRGESVQPPTRIPKRVLPGESRVDRKGVIWFDYEWVTLRDPRDLTSLRNADATWCDSSVATREWEGAWRTAAAALNISSDGLGKAPSLSIRGMADQEPRKPAANSLHGALPAPLEPDSLQLSSLAHFDFVRSEVTLNPGLADVLSRLTGIDLIGSAEYARLVLLHEAVHALDIRRLKELEVDLERLDPSDGAPLALLLEGRAEHVSAQVVPSDVLSALTSARDANAMQTHDGSLLSIWSRRVTARERALRRTAREFWEALDGRVSDPIRVVAERWPRSVVEMERPIEWLTQGNVSESVAFIRLWGHLRESQLGDHAVALDVPTSVPLSLFLHGLETSYSPNVDHIAWAWDPSTRAGVVSLTLIQHSRRWTNDSIEIGLGPSDGARLHVLRRESEFGPWLVQTREQAGSESPPSVLIRFVNFEVECLGMDFIADASAAEVVVERLMGKGLRHVDVGVRDR